MYSLADIAASMHARIYGPADFSGDFLLLTDSRTLTEPENTIFFALKTRYNDGHRYIPELIGKGVRIFVCTEKPETDNNCTILLVQDTLKALQDLSVFHRLHFRIPVLGITGSNGKTIVKEWLLQLLENRYNICASPKSYNSQTGVPLSVWQLGQRHELGIFEAGISTVGEMENLEHIILPDTGILTHLGSAHNEGFENPLQKLDEKLLLFKNCKTVLLAYQPEIIARIKTNVLSFGFNEPRADLNIKSLEKSGNRTDIQAEFSGKPLKFSIPFSDDASIENACLCCLVLLHLNAFDAADFSALRPVSMRMELKKGIQGCILVNDSYSNDMNALGTALSFLRQQAVHNKLTVILSDIEQSGLPAQVLYPRIRNLLLEKQIKRIIGIGKDYLEHKQLFEKDFECSFYGNTDDFLADFYKHRFQDESILIKGARRYGFEKIVQRLESVLHGTVLEINLSAALKNLNTIKSILPPGVDIMAMVKAFAYGSGSYEIAKLLCDKVRYLAVAYTDEGIALRKSGIRTPIMVMNADEENAGQLLQYGLEPVVYSTAQLKAILETIRLQPIRIHVEIDTGMHRLGFLPEDCPALCHMLQHAPNVQVASVFSHLSASDEPAHDAFTMEQFRLFRETAAYVEQQLGYHTIKHISNTAAAIRFGQEGLQMVRLGIGLYGIDPSGKLSNSLEPVFTLKTHISQIKHIKAHESIGYSRRSVDGRARTIAVLELGYADGLNRALSNGKGGFYIRGKFAPIAGNICMDMCMADVTDIDCSEGDEAVLFGREYPIEALADTLNTIPYEVLTSISQRVKRVYVSE